MVTRRRWTDFERTYIYKNYRTKQTAEIAQFLGRTEHAIRWEANQSGFKKSARCKTLIAKLREAAKWNREVMA
jgi:hypothetical protein